MNPAKAEIAKRHLAARVERIAAATPVSDIHTHLYDPAFGELLLWGIDELLVYHYLVAEVFRQVALPYEKFWRLAKKKTGGADLAEFVHPELAPFRGLPRGVDHP
jgi:hypothetical protein